MGKIRKRNYWSQNLEGKIIGIRTSSYKYWRSRTDSTKDVTLYDLQQDPNEEVNIAEKNQPIVDEMEQILNSMKKTFYAK